MDKRIAGLSHLCEFIEDCEYDVLSTRVLHLLGREAPHTSNPSSFIRYIYNRVILESTKVRILAMHSVLLDHPFVCRCALQQSLPWPNLAPSVQICDPRSRCCCADVCWTGTMRSVTERRSV